ncbi:MAG: hypothetical protein AAFQ94_17735, partial [Bacteroidota bacterium]
DSNGPWGSLLEYLKGLEPFEDKRHPSLYESTLFFKILKRNVFDENENLVENYILVYYDKREDKNTTLDQVGETISLSSKDGNKTIQVKLKSHLMNPRYHRIPWHITPPEVKHLNIEVISNQNIKFTIQSARKSTDYKHLWEYKRWLSVYLYKVYIGFPTRNGPDIFFEQELFSTVPQRSSANFLQDDTLELTINASSNLALIAILDEENISTRGLSIWFEGISGLVNIPEEISIN